MGAVNATGGLVRWLSGLDEDELVALLDRRPDVLFGAELRDLADLARRMLHPQSLATVMRTRALPCLQLAEASQILGEGCTRAGLADFLDGAGPHHRGDIDQVVDQLITNAVFSAGDDGRINLPDAFVELFPTPLGLGPPLRLLLQERPVEALRKIQTTLCLGQQKNRADTVASLISHFADVDKVRAILAGTPAEMIEYLAPFAQGRTYADEEIYAPRQYQQQQTTIKWAAVRGLIYGYGYGDGWQMPAEVSRAFREPGYHAPFTPRQPKPVTRTVDRTRVETDSSAAATQFADHALAVLDHIARVPVASVKSGGVGTRELTKLAKTTAAGIVEVRLALELAAGVGLLDRVNQTVAISDEFTSWRDADPAAGSSNCCPRGGHSAQHRRRTRTPRARPSGRSPPQSTAMAAGPHGWV
jgi:hypothetical protein